MKYFFRDKDKEADSHYMNGLAFCAAGVVVDFILESGKASVKYIDPFGNPNYAVREIDEIYISECSVNDYSYLLATIDDLFVD